MKIHKCKIQNNKGFSLVELLIVIVIVGVLSVVSYMAIQRARARAMNERMLDDLVAIANTLEDYRRDHQGKFPIPEPNPNSNQNILCYYVDATYAHDCSTAAFRQGMIDNTLLSKRYLRDVPTDPRTGSRYVYGVTNYGKYYQVAGIYEREDGIFVARTVENLAKGYILPSLIRAFDSANFVMNEETYLPYSPDHLVLSAQLDNINGFVQVNGGAKANTAVLYEGDEIVTGGDGSVDVYFSDGSITHLDINSTLELKHMQVDKNDSNNTITKILINLKAGKIWSKVVRLSEKSEFRVETTGAIAGVRGTEFGVDLALTNPFIFKSGEVWKKEKSDLALPSDPTAEEIMDTQEPVDSDPIGSASPPDYQDYYEEILLHSGIQPHILSVTGGNITVRNVDHFVEWMAGEFAFTRHMQASHLVAYPLSEINNDSPVAVAEQSIIPGTDPHLITVPTDLNEPLVLRFEYRKAGAIVRASGYSSVELQISSQTNLSEKDLYPNLFIIEEPELFVTAPQFVSFVGDPTEFEVEIDVINYIGPPLEYEIITQGPCSTVSPSTSPITVSTSTTGTCTLTLSTTLATGKQLSAEAAVEIVSGTQMLFLEHPAEGDKISEATVTPHWTTLNAPPFVTFRLTFGNEPLIDNALSGNNDFTVSPTGSPYTWTVVMFDDAGNELETQSANFEVIEQVSADFSITDQAGNHPDANGNLNTDTDQVQITLLVTDADTNAYAYQWGGTLPVASDTGPTNSANFTVEANTPASYSIILEVVSNTSGEVVASESKNITITYQLCGNNQINPGEDCDWPDLGNKTCMDLGYAGGELTCNADCTFNTGNCTAGPTLEEICVDVSGYFDGACWLLGEPDVNCIDTCAAVIDPIDGNPLECELNNATGDWNSNNTICIALGGSPDIKGTQDFAPFIVNGDCKERDTAVTADQVCGSSGPMGPFHPERICKCQ